MKKNFKYLLIVGAVVILPIKANALTGTFKVSCNDTNLRVGRSTRCTLKGQFDEALSGLHFSISKSDEVSISNVEIQEPYEKNTVEGLNYGLVRSGPVNTEHNIATFDVKLNSDIENPYVTLYNLEAVPAEGYDSYTQSNITVNFTNTKSSDNTLKTITVGGKTANVTTATTYEFTTNNNVEKVNISATTNDDGASVIGGGEKTLSVGVNTFTITVQAENGEEKEYTIKITRSTNNDGGSDVISNDTTDNTNNNSNNNSNNSTSNNTNNKSNTNKKETSSNTKKSTSNTVKNPKTGIYNGIGTGIMIITVAAMGYLIIRKEKYFNK